MVILNGVFLAAGLTILMLVIAICFIGLVVAGAAWLATALGGLLSRAGKHGNRKRG